MEVDVAKDADAGNGANIAKLKDYIVTNPIAVTTAIGSFIGGLLILTYLVSIQYFPSDISVSTVGFLLAGAAITGTLLTLLLALYLVFPGTVYRHMLNGEAESSQKQSGVKQLDLLSGRAIFWLLDIPSFIAFVTAVVAVFFTLNGFNWICFSAAILIVLLLLWYVKYCRKQKRIFRQFIGMLNRVYRNKWKSIFFFFVSGASALLPWFFLLLLIAQYARDTANEDLVWLMFFALGIFSIFANHWIAMAKKLWFLAIAAPALLFLSLLVTQQFSFIPKMVVRALMFGNISNANLLLDEQGCQIASQYVTPIFNLADSATKNKALKDKEDRKAITCRLLPVNLKWRIGNEYFVDATGAQLYMLLESKIDEGGKSKKKKPHPHPMKEKVVEKNRAAVEQLAPLLTAGFSISSAHVLSWSMDEQKKKAAQSQ